MWVLNREEKQSTLCYICILCQRLLATSDPRVKPNQGHPIDHVVPHPLSKLSQVRWMLLRRGVLGLRRCNLRRGCCLLLLLGRQGLVCLLRWVGLILRLPRIPDGLPGVRPRIPHLLATAVLAAQDFHYLCMATLAE